MILIFFLCFNLSMLHLCVSDIGYKCNRDAVHSTNNPTIHLINDGRNEFTNQLNDMFVKACESFYNIVNVPRNYYDQRQPTKENIIHFAVHNYYDGKPLNGFVYAGNVTKTSAAECRKENKDDRFDCNEIVNLVSESVTELNSGHLYNFVQKIDWKDWTEGQRQSCKPFFQHVTDLTTVLLCRAGTVNIQLTQPLKLTSAEHHCSNYSYLNSVSDHLLAVVAPEPFDVPFEYSVPTIFYNIPYMYSKTKTDFPNSMNLIPWRLLKYGFLKFMQSVGWERVVVVTDDSEYSIDFEGELTALFSREGIIYTVIRCEDANCDMNKIKQKLHEVAAKIVIANVEEEHARYLIKTDHSRITWLVRDMQGKRQTTNGDVFSLSLRTVNKKPDCDVDDNILTALSNIAQVYKKIPKMDEKVKKRKFYRRFANAAKEIFAKITKAIILVERLHSYGSEEVSTIHVSATGAEVMPYKNPFGSRVPSDGTGQCLLTSYDYFDVCQDALPLLLMCVLLLFITTILLISCFFDRTSPVNDVRYQSF